MHFKQIAFNSPGYQQALQLRQYVLRAPLGLNIQDDDLSQESQYQHFGLFDDDGKLLACAMLLDLGESNFQVRQMAVASDRQRQGLGTALLHGMEKVIGKNGGRRIVIEARDYAMGFYEGLGYTAQGEWFSKVGIAHKVMVKDLP